MKINEISTSYATENLASCRVLQKLGFQFIKEPYECNRGDIVTTGRYCKYQTR
jgi:ribosomal-protein-alanine N-acetyltransferase